MAPLAPHTALCRLVFVPTNLAIDDALLDRAKRLGHHRSKRETVNVALREYVRRREILRILDSFGTIEFDSSWDHKRERRSR
jgi:Arc/MetJ family transcription regulator